MNKICFTFSGILIVTGVVTLLKTTIINLIMPKIGRVAFQMAMAGSYSSNDYLIDFTGVNIAAVCLIVIGIISVYKLYKREKGK